MRPRRRLAPITATVAGSKKAWRADVAGTSGVAAGMSRSSSGVVHTTGQPRDAAADALAECYCAIAASGRAGFPSGGEDSPQPASPAAIYRASTPASVAFDLHPPPVERHEAIGTRAGLRRHHRAGQ